MSFHLQRTNQENKDFRFLVHQLDAELAIRDGEDHAFYNQFNGIGSLDHVVVGYFNHNPVACGAFKIITSQAIELKRMFVLPAARKKGHAKRVLTELEVWAAEKGYIYVVLETGKVLFEAMAFYPNQGYSRIPNFAPYVGVKNSVCFEKTLKK